jgi:hypothetical protein
MGRYIGFAQGSGRDVNSRLALGTVQFGLPYGVANEAGQVSRDEAAAILDMAWAAGVDTLDTAISYGDSERRLGEIGVARWRVISKLPPASEDCADLAAWARGAVEASMQRLGVGRLHAILLHRSGQLLGSRGEELYRGLLALRDLGYVQKIGVSIYAPEELQALWPLFHLDLVQAPFNVLDRRLLSTGWLTRLREAGTEVHVRSVFLQGLLLLPPARRPAKFRSWQSVWRAWHCWLNDAGLSPLQACVRFAFANRDIDRVVVGVESRAQLQEILANAQAPGLDVPVALMSEDLDLIDPSRWNMQ